MCGHEEVVVMTVVTQLKPTGAPEASFAPAASEAAVELYWLPLGGGWLVRQAERTDLGGHPGAPGAPPAARPLPHRAGGACSRGTLRHRELLADP